MNNKHMSNDKFNPVEFEKEIIERFERVGWTNVNQYHRDAMRNDAVLKYDQLLVVLEIVNIKNRNTIAIRKAIEKQIELISKYHDGLVILTNGYEYDVIHLGEVIRTLYYVPTPVAIEYISGDILKSVEVDDKCNDIHLEHGKNILELIKETISDELFSTLLTEKDQAELLKKIAEAGKKQYSSFLEMHDEYKELIAKNIDLEEKCRLAYEKIDSLEISESDQDVSYVAAKNAFKQVWEELEDNTKKYLATAYYLQMKNASFKELDFSPVIIEYCRSFENELREKLFYRYINSKYSRGYVKDYSRWNENSFISSLNNAIEDYNKNGSYFCSMNNMIGILSLLNSSKETKDSKTLSEFVEYLGQAKWDKNKLCEKTFISNSKICANDYRNASAHPDGLFGYDDADACKTVIKKVLRDYLKARTK